MWWKGVVTALRVVVFDGGGSSGVVRGDSWDGGSMWWR